MADRILPKHVGIIMDGNGRWAKKRMLPRSVGHRAGADTFKKIVRHANRIGIKYVTVYAFSTENWKRPAEEVEGIMNLLRRFLDNAVNDKDENVRTLFIGDRTPLADDIKEKMAKCEKMSENFDSMTLNIAVNYGGRSEILQATKAICRDVSENKISCDDIDESLFESYLYTKGQPDVDLIIRPSGEQRTSNFLPWQASYAELIFMDELWPDFNEESFDKALKIFEERNRRFGGI